MSALRAIDVIVLALAVWRVSTLLANETGPWDVLLKLRTILGVEMGTYGKQGTSTLSKLVICVWCSSIWFGILAAIAYYIAPGETVFVALGLAISAAAVLLEETTDRLMRE
jgi:hypothetical protein